MNNPSANIAYVPYRQKDEPPRKAALARVEFPLNGLTDEDIQVLGHLSEAVDLMTIYARIQASSRPGRWGA